LRGVNLDIFDFDYDLTWMAFFLSADERVLGPETAQRRATQRKTIRASATHR
jgi:hypothetical protein